MTAHMQKFSGLPLGKPLVQQGKGAVGKPGAFLSGKALGRRPRPGQKQIGILPFRKLPFHGVERLDVVPLPADGRRTRKPIARILKASRVRR